MTTDFILGAISMLGMEIILLIAIIKIDKYMSKKTKDYIDG